ncbi:hypothetical protein ABZ890_19090 [Streptomyces sp. NPDC046984]|uniref:hypothetical protein n=1 Tax=Streptomyces sp. NPDC046984 TaxID=3155138 RepID=UPI0033E95467
MLAGQRTCSGAGSAAAADAATTCEADARVRGVRSRTGTVIGQGRAGPDHVVQGGGDRVGGDREGGADPAVEPLGHRRGPGDRVADPARDADGADAG